MGLRQTCPSGAESEAGLEVMPIRGVTLSDGHCPGERAHCRRYGRRPSPWPGCHGRVRTGDLRAASRPGRSGRSRAWLKWSALNQASRGEHLYSRRWWRRPACPASSPWEGIGSRPCQNPCLRAATPPADARPGRCRTNSVTGAGQRRMRPWSTSNRRRSPSTLISCRPPMGTRFAWQVTPGLGTALAP
jgi:hypothetical protein